MDKDGKRDYADILERKGWIAGAAFWRACASADDGIEVLNIKELRDAYAVESDSHG